MSVGFAYVCNVSRKGTTRYYRIIHNLMLGNHGQYSSHVKHISAKLIKAIRLEAIAIRLKAIAIRLEAIANRLETIPCF